MRHIERYRTHRSTPPPLYGYPTAWKGGRRGALGAGKGDGPPNKSLTPKSIDKTAGILAQRGIIGVKLTRDTKELGPKDDVLT